MASQPKHKDLVAAIRSLARIHQNVTDEPASAATVIGALRERGQHAEADELERIVELIRARRRRQD